MSEPVLIVDDSLTVRMSLSASFQGAGFQTLLAATAAEARALITREKISLIVLDVLLPDADGLELLQELKTHSSAPVLLLSSEADVRDRLRGLRTGADDYVGKPYDSEYLIARCRELLHAQPRQAPGAGTVLLVDDCPTFRSALQEALEREGHQVIVAQTGEEGLRLAATHRPAMVMVDDIMPGLDGVSVIRRLRLDAAMRGTLCVLLTGSTPGIEVELRALDSGADDFVSKASDLEVIKARVRAQLRRKQFEDEHRRVREALLRTEMQAVEERCARQLAETKALMVEELERKNREFESFSYSISHDLRAPLRSIDGFSLALLEDATTLDDAARANLKRVRAAAQRMNSLIDALLKLSRVARSGVQRARLDLTELANSVLEELKLREPERTVSIDVRPAMIAQADEPLVRTLLENLVGNAWKFTKHATDARIEVGEREGAFYVRDNGAGFDMAYAAKLFTPFQRLHREADFPGTGIGLATVARIVDRHGGRVWAEATIGQGATFLFTLSARHRL